MNPLPDRHHLEDELDRDLRSGDGSGALIHVAIERLRQVNISVGREAGECVLAHVAECLREAVGRRGAVYRVSADELVALVRDVDDKGIEDVVASVFWQASEPVRVGGCDVVAQLRMGSVRHPLDGRRCKDLLRRAENALCQSRLEGASRHVAYLPDMEVDAVCRFHLEHELRRAVELNQLVLLYQPIVELHSSRLVGAEALLYWDRPGHGRMSPATFLPLAEQLGLMESLIGDWVIAEAVRQAAAWRAAGRSAIRVSVNLARQQFNEPGRLPEVVAQALARHRYPASGLELEITEQHLMHEPTSVLDTMRALSAMGTMLSLDDFGTGYSCLSILRQFPFDRLKIDRVFINGLGLEQACDMIVGAVARLGRNLGMTVVAEGVERAAQIPPLLAYGCLEAQGFLFGRPQPATELERVLELWG